MSNGFEAEKEQILTATGVSEAVISAMIKHGFLYKKDVLVNEDADEQIVNLSKHTQLTDEQQDAANIRAAATKTDLAKCL